MARKLLEESSKNLVIGIGRTQKIQEENYRHITADFSNPEEAQTIDFSSYLSGESQKVVLINNAGVIDPIAHLGDTENQELINHFNINLLAPALLTNNFISQLSGMGPEKLILNVSSGAARNPYDGWGCYCSSKAGLEMLARVVDTEQQLKRNEFKIFSVSPGVIDTPMQDTIRSTDETRFSNKQKFVNLKKENLLKDPDKIAEDFSYIIRDPEKHKDLTINL